jgi:hypothetical protein
VLGRSEIGHVPVAVEADQADPRVEQQRGSPMTGTRVRADNEPEVEPAVTGLGAERPGPEQALGQASTTANAM